MTGRCHLSSAIVAGMLVVASSVPSSPASDWNQWHGPNRDGVVSQSSGYSGGQWNITQSWRTGQSNVPSVGYGISSPLVVKRAEDTSARVYVMGWTNNKDYLYCLDANTGLKLWDESYDSPAYGRTANANKEYYKGVMATPVMDLSTGYLYALSCDGEVYCWDTKKSSSRAVWNFNLHTRYGGVPAALNEDYGFVASPLLLNDWLIIEVGDEQGNVMAFNKTTGAEVWKSANTDDRGWGSPALLMVEGKPCIATMTRRNMIVVRADSGHTGETLSSYSWQSTWSGSIPSPVAVDNKVLFSLADGSGCRSAMRSLTLSGATTVFDTSSFWYGSSTAVIHEDNAYFAHVAKIRCINMSGSSVWASGDIMATPHGSFDAASMLVCSRDDKMIVMDGLTNGVLRLVEATPSPASYRELAKISGILTTKEERHYIGYSHVVMGHGKIIARSMDGDIVCYSAPQGGGTVRISETTDEGLACYKIETDNATYYYDKAGGGFTSLLDTDGVDWITFHPQAGTGSAGEYRGIPNSGELHPGELGGITTTGDQLDVSLPKVTINTQRAGWAARWEFFPTYAKMTMTTVPSGGKYWLLYEGTPGGAVDGTDRMYLSNGRDYSCNSSHPWNAGYSAPDNFEDISNTSGTATGMEWAFFAASEMPRSLFMVHTDDTIEDDYWQMQDNMTVFGFGRNDSTEQLMNQTDGVLTIGFVESRDVNTVKSAIAAATASAVSDNDNDGIADEWETVWLGGTNQCSPKADNDGDGHSNWEEYIAGTDPTNKQSCLALQVTRVGDALVVSYPSIQAAGTGYGTFSRLYDLQTRPQLTSGSWGPVAGATNRPGDNTTKTYTDLTPPQSANYRVTTRLQ